MQYFSTISEERYTMRSLLSDYSPLLWIAAVWCSMFAVACSIVAAHHA